MTITLDDKKLIQFEKDLAKFSKTAVPYAIRTTVNNTAWKARQFAQDKIDKDFVQRNQFTKRSIRVVMARAGGDTAIMGTIAPYMETQEKGGTKQSKGQFGKPIPTPTAAGQDGAGTRTKVVQKANRMSTIQLNSGASKRGVSKKYRNKLAIFSAVKNKRTHVFLYLGGGRQGIFRVKGDMRRPTIRMVQDLSHKSVTIPRNPIIEPAADRARGHMQQIWYDALLFQSKRLGLMWS